MKGTVGLLVPASIGYVLGARDGRERYDKITAQAKKLWERPEVHNLAKVPFPTGSEASSSTAPRTNRLLILALARAAPG